MSEAGTDPVVRIGERGPAEGRGMSAGLSGKAIAHVLDEIGITPVTRLMVGAACLGYLFDGFDNFLLGGVMPLISRDFHLSPAMQGLILSTTLWGGGRWVCGSGEWLPNKRAAGSPSRGRS